MKKAVAKYMNLGSFEPFDLICLTGSMAERLYMKELTLKDLSWCMKCALFFPSLKKRLRLL